jgi:citrate lyase subunit beta / citryl-CoA lyase
MLPSEPSPGAVAVATARTLLYVPGNRRERFDKALASGADLVIVDFEDSVAAADKDSARTTVAAWLDPSHPVVVRVNSSDSPWYEKDLAVCRLPGVAAIAVPRAAPGEPLARAANVLPVVALIETAVGVQGLTEIAATPNVVRLGIGAIDLTLDLGMTATDALDPILLQMVIASRAAGCAPPVAGVTPEFRDLQLIEKETRRARALGFSAKLCIHPAQLAPVKRGLGPSAAEIAHAHRVVGAATASGGSAVALDGRMVDHPVIEHARRVLAARA